MEKYLSISQLAKLKNVSTETLRHYDRIDLFKPGYVNEYTGYRYYDYSQIEEFDTIIDLKAMGLSINEIKEFISDRNIETSENILMKRAEVLKLRIHEEKKLLDAIKQKISYIQGLDSQKGTGNIELHHFGRRRFVICGKENSDYNEFIKSFTRLKLDLREEVNGFASSICGALIDRDSFIRQEGSRYARFPAFPAKYCQTGLSYGRLYVMDESDYLTIRGRGTIEPSDSMSEDILRYIDDNNFEITGNPYEWDILDVSVTGNLSDVIFQIEVPVKKKS